METTYEGITGSPDTGDSGGIGAGGTSSGYNAEYAMVCGVLILMWLVACLKEI